MNGKVSCICPTRGRFETLKESVSFFLLQDYPNKELIIFNNHPTPIEGHPKLSKQGIKIINAGDYSGKSMEVIYADAMKHISPDSEYVAIWDDDDMYFPWHLSSNIEKLENSGKRAIRARFGYWYDIHHSMGDHVTIISNTLEASMIGKKGVIFFEETVKDKTHPSWIHPHTSWVSKVSEEDGFTFNYEITASFRWGYGKTYHHLQSSGAHNNNTDLGLNKHLKPCSVSNLFYDLVNKATITTDLQNIVTFTPETKSELLRRFLHHSVDKFDHVDRFKVWLYWDAVDVPFFISMCHNSIIDNTYCEVVIINDETINQYQLPEQIMNLHSVQRSDYLRIFLLYRYGGFWFDSDTYIVGDLDEHYFRYLTRHETIFPWEYNVVGNMTTPIFSSKPYGLIITQAFRNIENYLKTNPSIGWNGIGVNGIMKSVTDFKHRGEGYFHGLKDIAVFGYNNGEVSKWDFSKLSTSKLQMIIFHWSQIGAEVSWKIGLDKEKSHQKLVASYPNLDDLIKHVNSAYN